MDRLRQAEQIQQKIATREENKRMAKGDPQTQSCASKGRARQGRGYRKDGRTMKTRLEPGETLDAILRERDEATLDNERKDRAKQLAAAITDAANASFA